MVSLNEEEKVYTEISNGYTNISFVKDEHDYGKIKLNSDRTNDSGKRFSIFHGKSRLVIAITLVIIVVTASIVVPVVIVFTSKEGFHKDNAGLQTTPTASTSVDEGSTAAPTGLQTTATASISVSEGSTSASTVPSSSSWGAWTECTVTCGQGVHTRYRSCNGTSSNCDYVQTGVCEETICPLMGRWVTWSQWGSCNTACGGGIQSRTRSCSKMVSSDLDCVGENLQKRECNNWKCPDCSQKCNVGTLNGDCTACVCNGMTVSGRIRSSTTENSISKTGNSISNAAVYDSAAPTSILALSNATGYFVLTTKCIQSELLITKEGFVDKTTVISGSYIEIELVKTVAPFLIQTPEPKVRLTGENVTLCCEAEGTPSITYYEWLKDSVLIDKTEDVNRSQILLTDLSTGDTGYYQCRANSDVGAVISTPVQLVVRENPAVFCKDALKQKKIVLPDDCVQLDTNTSLYEVGECIAKSCRSYNAEDKEQCTDGGFSCCSADETTIETVNCTDYSLEVVVIKSCGCGDCYQEKVLVSGVVTGIEIGSYVPFCNVLVNGKLKTYTNLKGLYTFSINKSESRVTITVIDESSQYLPTTKVISLENSIGGLLQVDLKMVKAAEPIIVDSSLENTLSAGTSSNSSPKIELRLPANSFYYPNGTAYSGFVKAMFTYLDPSNVSDLESIPGVFQYTNEDGELGNLDSLGVFNLYVEDLNGQNLEIANPVETYIPASIGNYETYEHFKLWTLNTQSGIWEVLSFPQVFKRQTRSKRDTAMLIGQFNDINKELWYNYDQVSSISPNVCYFKICLFTDPSLTVKVNSLTGIRVHIYVKRNDIFYTVYVSFDGPDKFITNTFCDGDQALIVPTAYGKKIYVADPSLSSPTTFQIASDQKSLQIALSVSPQSLFHSSSSFNDNSCLNLYYFQTNTNYEWKYDETVLNPDAINCLSPKASLYYLYWRSVIPGAGFRVCFVKVKVRLSVGISFLRSEKVKIRVVSSVPSKSSSTKKIIGIIEKEIKLDNGAITECIEYRCSGPSNPCDDHIYNTTVEVIIEHSRKDVVFSVDSIADDSQSISPFVKSSDKFKFQAPFDDGSKYLGIYTAHRDTIREAENHAREYCSTTRISNGTPNPDLGMAVTFLAGSTSAATSPNVKGSSTTPSTAGLTSSAIFLNVTRSQLIKSTETPNEFCADSFQQKTIALPEDCVQPSTNTATYEVGECISKACRRNETGDSGCGQDEVISCCSIGEADLETVQCSGYKLELFVVRLCSCSVCDTYFVTMNSSDFGPEDSTGTSVRRPNWQNTAAWVGEINWSTILYRKWFNVDQVYRLTDQACFFKVRLFKDKNLNKSVPNPERYIYLQYHILDENVVTTITDRIYYPEDDCVPGICNEKNAYISLFYYGRIGYEVMFAGRPELGSFDTSYTISDENKVLKIKMSSTVDGPFYENKTKCIMSSATNKLFRYHFGETIEAFTLLSTFTPIQGIPIVTQLQLSRKAWYPKRNTEGYRVCFIKVRVLFEAGTILFPWQPIKIKATSFGGTNSHISGVVLGIREFYIDSVGNASTYCLEYKCSGIIDPLFDPDFDYTRVTVELIYPKSDIKCTVSKEADFISSDQTGLNVPRNGSSNEWEMYAPTVYSPNVGLYSETSDRLDLRQAFDKANSYCKSGEVYTFSGENPEKGLGLTFSCGNTKYG